MQQANTDTQLCWSLCPKPLSLLRTTASREDTTLWAAPDKQQSVPTGQLARWLYPFWGLERTELPQPNALEGYK